MAKNTLKSLGKILAFSKYLILALLLLSFISIVSAQPVVEWEKTYGGDGKDWAYSVQQTSDGGYIVAGFTESSGLGSSDAWILKLDSNGNVQWQKTYGGNDWDYAYAVQQTTDGGYIVAGWKYIYPRDIYVIKLDLRGNIEWEKTYGGSGEDEAWSIQQTSDGGYIVAGYTSSFGNGSADIYILKLDSNGNIEWEKTYGGSSDDRAYSIQQTSDGGYIVAGSTYSFREKRHNIYILKLDSNGNIEWEKTYGGSSDDAPYDVQLYTPKCYSVRQTKDGGYIVVGLKYLLPSLYGDIYILKLDSNGNIEWEKTYGGSSDDRAYSIQQTSDGGYIVAGRTESFGNGGHDAWILKLDNNGNIEWQKAYGGNSRDEAQAIQQTSDGGYIVAGFTRSFGNGEEDFYVIKLSPEETTTPTLTSTPTPTPTPTPTSIPVLTPTPTPTPISTPRIPSTEKFQNPILLLGLILLIVLPVLVIAKSVRKGEPEKTEKRKEEDLEYEQKIKEFKAKLEEWEREGYNVSKLRERWFK